VLALVVRAAVVTNVVDETIAQMRRCFVGDPGVGVLVLDPDEARGRFAGGKLDGAEVVVSRTGLLVGEGFTDELACLPVFLLAGGRAIAGVGASRA